MKKAILALGVLLASVVVKAGEFRVLCKSERGVQVRAQFPEELLTVPLEQMPDYAKVTFQPDGQEAVTWNTPMYGILNYPKAKIIDFYADAGRRFISFQFPYETGEIYLTMNASAEFQFDGQCQREQE